MITARTPTTAGGGRYTHPMEIRNSRGELVGYVAMCGCEPVYLDADDVARWNDRKRWMDLDSWRNWVGGTLSDYIVTSVHAGRRPSGRPVPETPGPSATSGKSGAPLQESLRRPDTHEASNEGKESHGRRRR